jgi:coenzyme F420 hydrogenase subunit beta
MLPAGSPTIAKVVKGELCSGCGLCASLSGAAMRAVPPGYNRPGEAPLVDAETERVIAGSCPGSVVAPWHEAPNVHPYWGPWHQVLTGYSTNEDVRHRASSGGGITALALHALQTGRVSRVIQISADSARPTRNVMTVSRTAQEVIEGAGSRYAASSPLEDIDRALDEEGPIAFIGKPCDASALRQFGKFDARVAERIPLVFAFFCAGIPSETGARNILNELGVPEEELAEFRYRGFGWPGRATAIAHDGRSADMSYADSWGGHLSKEVQFRCKICPDAVGGVADIACADAWYGGESGYPSFDEQSGRSLIITRTATGDDFLRGAVGGGALAVEPLDIGEIDLMQPSQSRRKRLIVARTAATRATLQPVPRMDGLKVGEAARRAGVKESLHNFLGTARRILSGRR